ncbi:MAG: hypothetical protein LC099_04895 [Anaerolineales bacterium]|nr:hypothetical protein [Anaerolineales bacterium]
MKRLIAILIILSAAVSACNFGRRAPSLLVADATEIKSTPTIAAATMEEIQDQPTAESAPQTLLPSEGIDAPIVESPNIVKIRMLNEQDGWSVSGAKVFRTNDGGVTWYGATPLDAPADAYSVLTDFLDAKAAWALYPSADGSPDNGTLYRTSDGGATWNSFSAPFSEGDLEFLDAKNGWMMANLGVGAGSMGVAIFQTRDGGETWTRTYANDPNVEGASDSLPLGGLKNFIRPVNMDTAWVGGVIYMTGRVYLYRTDDGGANWAEQPIILSQEAAGGEVGALDLTFFAPSTGMLVLRSSGDVLLTEVYISQNGGATWAQTDATLKGYGSLQILSADDMIFFADGKFNITQDAGKTWNAVQPDQNFADTLVAMDFVSPQMGWAVASSDDGANILYRTEDGGSTWFAIAR